jgi:hypothetical protein
LGGRDPGAIAWRIAYAAQFDLSPAVSACRTRGSDRGAAEIGAGERGGCAIGFSQNLANADTEALTLSETASTL